MESIFLGDGSLGVLVVEDNPDDEALTVRGLKKTGLPLTITVARDGSQAVEMLHGGLEKIGLARPPRLILLDLKLPKMSGLEVLEVVRGHAETASIPVVCLTSSDELSDTQRAYRLGANSFVRKPLEYATYLEIVGKTAEYWLAVNFWPS